MLKLLILKFVKNIRSQCGDAAAWHCCVCVRPVWRGMLECGPLKTLQHVSTIIQIIFRELVCSLLKYLILKFV